MIIPTELKSEKTKAYKLESMMKSIREELQLILNTEGFTNIVSLHNVVFGLKLFGFEYGLFYYNTVEQQSLQVAKVHSV